MRRHGPIALLILAGLAFAACGWVVRGAATLTAASYETSSPQCEGVTLAGRRCRRRVKDASGFCYSHLWQQPAARVTRMDRL